MRTHNPVHPSELTSPVGGSDRLVPTTPNDRPATTRGECVFCRIVAGREPANMVREWADVIAISPLRPITTGHTLVVPKDHVPDIGTSPAVSARAMARAAELAAGLASCNLITSKGEPATQSVFHLHIHLVPRHPDDGLVLPWTSRQAGDPKRVTPPPRQPPA